MMHPYPFFGGASFRRPHHYYSYPKPPHNIVNNSSLDEEKPCFPSVSSKSKSETFNNLLNTTETRSFKSNNVEKIENNSDECFEILGLKLHFDDLLIIALLFFLYQEDVKDTYLYIALILLLLS